MECVYTTCNACKSLHDYVPTDAHLKIASFAPWGVPMWRKKTASFGYKPTELRTGKMTPSITGDHIKIVKWNLRYTQKPTRCLLRHSYQQYLVLFTLVPRSIIVGLQSRCGNGPPGIGLRFRFLHPAPLQGLIIATMFLGHTTRN